jgi:hypothetical protein
LMNNSIACVAGSSCSSDQIRCDGPEDCPGEVCCERLNGPQTQVRHLDCQSQCGTDPRICHTSQDCPAGLQCVPSSLLPGYYHCG